MQTLPATNQIIETTAIDISDTVSADEYQSLRAEILELAADIAQKTRELSNSVSDLGGLLKKMRNKNLYRAEFHTWEEFCKSLKFPGFNGLSYKRANQFILASETQQDLIQILDPSYENEILNLNENTIRQLRSFPPEAQASIAQTMFAESAETGVTPNSKLVSQIGSELDFNYDDIAAEFRHIGQLQRYNPTSAKTKKYRYSFEAEGKSALFETLPEAKNWLTQYSSTQTRSCLNCAHCDRDERVNPDEIFCTLKGYVVLEERAAIMPDICNTWSNHVYSQTKFELIPNPIDKTPHSAGILATSAKTGDKDPERNERYTPEFLWRPGLDLFGVEQYDLDPASCANATVPAKTRYTKQINGLNQIWQARYLFANFPFSLNLEFTFKLIEAINNGTVLNAIICLKTDHRTKWYNHLLFNCACYCLVNKQVQYINTDHSSFFGSTLFFFGKDEKGFYKTHRHLGSINKSMSQILDVDCLIPDLPTNWTGIEIRNLWRQIGNISERPKYKTGFLVDNDKLDIHFEFQTQIEAWNAWTREKDHLLEIIP